MTCERVSMILVFGFLFPVTLISQMEGADLGSIAQDDTRPHSQVVCGGNRAGARLPAPSVRVNEKRGSNPRAPKGMSDRADPGTRQPAFDHGRTLPKPTKAEIEGKKVDKLLGRIEGLTADCLTLEDVYAALPELKRAGVFVWDDPWTIGRDQGHSKFWSQDLGRTEVYIGAAVILADLQRIKRAERDYIAYYNQFASTYEAVYPVDGTYHHGFDAAGPFTRVDVYYHSRKRFGCTDAKTIVPILEHCVNGRLVTDSYATGSDYKWMAGRDTYYPICNAEGKVIGYLIVTAFGFDIDDCWDGSGDVRDAIRDNLRYMKDTAEKRRYTP